MPRTARLLLDKSCYHILTRGNNRAMVFHEAADFQRYGQLLLAYFTEHRIRLYHYCLMSNHVHLVVEASTATGLTKAMHGLNLSYALSYRRRYGHSGHFWQDRFRSLVIAKDSYLLQCGTYVELNPVRARMVPAPETYAWSSYRVYASGRDDPLVKRLNPVYLALGRNPEERQHRYRKFVEEQIAPQTEQAGHWLKQPAVGSAMFLAALTEQVGTSIMWRPRGRPRKQPSVTSSETEK